MQQLNYTKLRPNASFLFGASPVNADFFNRKELKTQRVRDATLDRAGLTAL
jgi:hypothetical protein